MCLLTTLSYLHSDGSLGACIQLLIISAAVITLTLDVRYISSGEIGVKDV